MAKILISSKDKNKYLTGNLSQNEYSFTHNYDNAFCFDTAREAEQFMQEEPVKSFLENTLTELVDYNKVVDPNAFPLL